MGGRVGGAAFGVAGRAAVAVLGADVGYAVRVEFRPARLVGEFVDVCVRNRRGIRTSDGRAIGRGDGSGN